MSEISNDVFAEPMLEGDDFLQEYFEGLKDLIKKGLLPDLREKMTYKVYSIKQSGIGSHKSIVLTADDEQFFTVELGFITVDGANHIYPVTQPLHPDSKGKLVYHGQIKTKGAGLISKAIATMKKFGTYFKFCNNCQNYCNYYLDAVGLGQEKAMTDGDKLTVIGIAGAILILLFKFLQ